MEALARRVGWRVGDRRLLARSMAHRSWVAETPGSESNERLEFLGDAVLGLVVTDHLFRTYPAMPEGELAKVRASVVNSTTLAEVAASLDLGSALLLGKGEGQSGGREKPSILADTMEAVIGAVYLDRGWGAASALVMRVLGELIEQAAAGPGGHDYKTRLQELCAQRFDELPRYQVADEGPDHAKRFAASVRLAGAVRGTGEGRSKKQAEQAAARVAWENLVAELDGETTGAAPSTGITAGAGSARVPAADGTDRVGTSPPEVSTDAPGGGDGYPAAAAAATAPGGGPVGAPEATDTMPGRLAPDAQDARRA